MRRLGLLVILIALAVGPSGASPARAADRERAGVPPDGRGTAGPPYTYRTEILGGKSPDLNNRALVRRTEHGYRYRAGPQGSRIHVSLTAEGRLRIADRSTRRWKHLAPGCTRVRAERGIVALCRVGDPTRRRPLLVEIWPGLGHDHVDGSGAPPTVAMTVLADRGRDVALFGAGWDFFNGHTGADTVRGGAGADWIRSGADDDRVKGGPGADQVIDAHGGRDRLFGGGGPDLLGGGDGNDRLRGGPGADRLRCGPGRDRIDRDPADRRDQCNP